MVVTGHNHLSNRYKDSNLPKGWIIALSKYGWTTNEIDLIWIKNFNKHTRSRSVGGYWLLVLDGHESHRSADFEHFGEGNNIITLCMPAYQLQLQ